MTHYDQLWQEQWLTLQAVGPLTHTRYRLIRRELAPLVMPGQRVLDVGCGNGTLVSELLRSYPDIDFRGLESSAEAVRHAAPGTAQRIVVGDLYTTLPQMVKHPIDIIISSEVLEHLEAPQQALVLMYNALRQGGKAVITIPAGKRWWSSQDVHAGHVQRFEQDQFTRMLEDAGFRIRRIYCWGISVALIYDRLAALIGPERIIQAGNSRFGAWLARQLVQLFRIEDAFPSRHGFQLVAVVEKP